MKMQFLNKPVIDKFNIYYTITESHNTSKKATAYFYNPMPLNEI